MAKADPKKDESKNAVQPERQTIDAAISAAADQSFEGGDYFQREDYVVKGIAGEYKASPDDVRAKLRASIDAKSKLIEAEKAQAAADEAARVAQEKAEAARSAAAATKGMVIVTVPKAFKLTLDNGHVVHVKPGVQDMDPDHARHWYAKANGVEEFKTKGE